MCSFVGISDGIEVGVSVNASDGIDDGNKAHLMLLVKTGGSAHSTRSLELSCMI